MLELPPARYRIILPQPASIGHYDDMSTNMQTIKLNPSRRLIHKAGKKLWLSGCGCSNVSRSAVRLAPNQLERVLWRLRLAQLSKYPLTEVLEDFEKPPGGTINDAAQALQQFMDLIQKMTNEPYQIQLFNATDQDSNGQDNGTGGYDITDLSIQYNVDKLVGNGVEKEGPYNTSTLDVLPWNEGVDFEPLQPGSTTDLLPCLFMNDDFIINGAVNDPVYGPQTFSQAINIAQQNSASLQAGLPIDLCSLQLLLTYSGQP